MNLVDLTGKRYGRLVVSRRAPNRQYGRQSHVAWECRCDCGTVKVVTGANLFRSTRSCGCTRGESIREKKRSAPGASGLTKIVASYRASARKRRLPFELTRPEIESLVSGACWYCGKEPSRTVLTGGHRSQVAAKYAHFPHNGIDRVDSRKGYVASNVVSCCVACNFAKHTMTTEEFLRHIGAIYNHRIAHQERTG